MLREMLKRALATTLAPSVFSPNLENRAERCEQRSPSIGGKAWAPIHLTHQI